MDIPDCSDSDPAFLEIKYNDQVFMTPYTESEGAQNSLNLEAGIYTVNDVNVLDSDLNIIYQVPNEEDERFDLSGYVNITTPFEVNVSPINEREFLLNAVCFTPIPYTENSGIKVSLLEFQPLYYILPLTNNGCFDELQVTLLGAEVVQFTIENYSRTSKVLEFVAVPQPVPVNPDGGGLSFRLLKDGEDVFERIFSFGYNVDGIVTSDEIVDASLINCQ